MATEAPGGVMVPARRPGASAVELDDNLAVYDDVGQILILLNASAASVWERCDGATTLDDMVRALQAAHPDDAADIDDDVRQTVGKLMELGLLVEAGPGAAGPAASPAAGQAPGATPGTPPS
jgi:hypothetical protein